MAPANNQSMIKWNLPIYQQNMSQWGGVKPMTNIPSTIAAPNQQSYAPPPLGSSTSFWEDFMTNPVDVDMPKKEGSWIEPAQIGLGAAKIGLGVYNALEQAKMNKFMRGYYGDMMDMQRTDFSNAAKSTNESLAARARTRASAAGHTFDSTENKEMTSDYMKQWGVKETF